MVSWFGRAADRTSEQKDIHKDFSTETLYGSGFEVLLGPCFVDISQNCVFIRYLPLCPKPYQAMRGQRNFNEVVKGNGIDNTARRGRNNALLTRRNDCLVARYYYYGSIKNKGYEETLKLLVTEFYLSALTIANLVLEHMDAVIQLKQKCPTAYYFSNRWPHMKW